MLGLREYRRSADRLADHLPWAALIARGVILNKDGSFMRVARFRGPDLESATEAELVSTCARAKDAITSTSTPNLNAASLARGRRAAHRGSGPNNARLERARRRDHLRG